MGLLIGLIVLAIVWVSCLPASQGRREGQDFYWQCRREQSEHWRKEARKQDCFHDPKIGTMNTDFYGDGSIKHDCTTGKRYEKGRYYCRSDGMMANYQQADAEMKRPPR